MSSTDYLRLNDLKLFKKLPGTIPKGIKKTLNVLTIKSDVLFVWNFEDSCLLTLNLKAAKSREGDHVCYQTLLPTSPPVFSPELLVTNECCEITAVAGAQGILLMELPRRGAPHGSFAGGKEMVYCKSTSLDDRLFACNKLVEVRQVKWHPGSSTDNILVVLTSNNMFRFYTIQNNLTTSVQVYQIGTQPIGMPPGTRLPFLAGLGETGVDFDFGLPVLSTKIDCNTKWEDLRWPIYILRGDGEIFTLLTDINNKKSALLKGPMAMYPSDEDNYGEEACAILCFKTTPPVLAISTCTGTIYHGVVLTPNDETEFGEKTSVVKYANYSIHPADKVLYVFESIELELGLASTDSDTAYSCPVFLHADESNKGKYYCTHETGVHGVRVPMISELDKFLAAKKESLDTHMPNLSNNSVAEYILCTHAAASSKINPVLGFAQFYYPTTIIVLLASGQVVTLPMSSSEASADELDLHDPELTPSPLKNMLKEPFDVFIKKCLKFDINQPFIKLSKDHKPNIRESHELLLRSIQIFREEHFKKYMKVYEEIVKRIKALQLIKEQQIKEINKLTIMKQNMQENAERLAEKYEDIKDKQEELTKRCEKLLVLITQKQPRPCEAEKNLYKELSNAERTLIHNKKLIDQIKSKKKYQEIQMQNWMKYMKKEDLSIGSNQLTMLKENLKDMTETITTMMEEIRICKDELGLK